MQSINLDEEPSQPAPWAVIRPAARERVRATPRDPDERAALTALVVARWDQYIKSGQLEILGPRSWRLHLGEDRVREYLLKHDSKGSDA